MTSSEQDKIAVMVFERVCNSLDENNIRKKVDWPIDRVVERFTHTSVSPMTPKTAQEVIVAFVANIYAEGLHVPCNKSGIVAQTVRLLDRYYQGNYTEGYMAAILDAQENDLSGFGMVLGRIADIIKTVERRKYIQAILLQYVDRSNWSLQLSLASILQEKLRDVLPEPIRQFPPERLVSHLKDLIQIHLEVTSPLDTLLGKMPEK